MNAALPEPDADERALSERLAAAIRAEIRASGPMPFARYMERCLYAPGLGYYSAGRSKFGAAGDFVTAPELGALFARCVARACAPALLSIGAAADVVELGGGSGAFAVAAMRELAALDALPHRYAILEPSADLRQRQRQRVVAELPAALADRFHWLDTPPARAWRGVLFANEVVDALPVARFAIRHGGVDEECVDVDGDGFVRADRRADAALTAAVRAIERDLDAALADGYRSELPLSLPAWLHAVVAHLDAGIALFVDYGYPRREYYHPQRRDGTLVCHYRHRAHADPLHWPGLQDISAFVDFSALAEAGVGAGLDLVGYATQAQFLLGHGLPALVDAAADLALPDGLRVIGEAKRLLLPGDMGERFQAIGFARHCDAGLEGLRGADLSRRL